MTEAFATRVPHLTTAMNGPLQQLEKHLLAQQIAIEGWLRCQWRKTPPPVYASVDLRNAGFKLAPVDTNLFPAGFNNLNPDFLPLAIQAVQATLEQIMPGCLRVLLIPEDHTRNMFYFENLAALQEILLKAGFAVRLGSLSPEITETREINLPSGRSVQLEPIQRNGNRIGVKDFSPCFILLNNDLSSGVPDILKNLEQAIVPIMQLGWANRLKSKHFQYYADVAREFAELIDIDPWLINPYFSFVENINFLKREGEEALAEQTQKLLDDIQRKYDEYKITHKPFVVIKADAGTYGMGVLSIHSAAEIQQLNRKQRTAMSTAKGSRPISRVMIQEGVYTFETWQQAVAEPVVYMIGQHVIGGFYRIHTERGVSDNLNSPGMQFVPLAFVEACNNPQPHCATPDLCANRFYSYGVIARLALVAAAREQQAFTK
jgi:glutamate--cysteine ligase